MASVCLGVLAAAVIATVSACNTCFLGPTNCPEISATVETSIPAPSPPLRSVTTTGPCTTNFTSGDSEGPVLVTGSAVGTCRVRGTLADGSEVEATLVYGQANLGCCGTTLELVSYPSRFLPAVDAGAP